MHAGQRRSHNRQTPYIYCIPKNGQGGRVDRCMYAFPCPLLFVTLLTVLLLENQCIALQKCEKQKWARGHACISMCLFVVLGQTAGTTCIASPLCTIAKDRIGCPLFTMHSPARNVLRSNSPRRRSKLSGVPAQTVCIVSCVKLTHFADLFSASCLLRIFSQRKKKQRPYQY